MLQLQKWKVASTSTTQARFDKTRQLWITFKNFFYENHFLGLYWICYNLLVFYALVFDPEAYEILVPWPGIKSTHPALEGQVFKSLTVIEVLWIIIYIQCSNHLILLPFNYSSFKNPQL